jgi:hypothetical protein
MRMYLPSCWLLILIILCLPVTAQQGPAAAQQPSSTRFEVALSRAFGASAGQAASPGTENSKSSASKEAATPAPATPTATPPAAPPASSVYPAAIVGRGMSVPALSIFVLVGKGAVNSIRSGSAVSPVVEVRDDRNLPVEGAEVMFQLPPVGPGGFFAGQELSWKGRTDANGQVVASFSPNHEAGKFGIQVTASFGGAIAKAVIPQTNSPKIASTESHPSGKRSGWWKIATVAAAGGAIAGTVWATHDSGSRPTVSFQPGTITFGGPR